jgi:hypothetical protein
MRTVAHWSESAFVSFVSCLDACLDAVGVRPPLDRAATVSVLCINSACNLTGRLLINQFNNVHDRHHGKTLHLFKVDDVALAKFHYLQSFKLHNLAYLRPEPDVLLTFSFSSQHSTDCEFKMAATVAASVGLYQSPCHVLEHNENPKTDAGGTHTHTMLIFMLQNSYYRPGSATN